MSACCNRIDPALMEALQLLKFSGKQGHSLNFTEELSANAQLALLEEEMSQELATPEDIMAFCESLS